MIKKYNIPSMQIVRVVPQDIVSSSNDVSHRYFYGCPYMPEVRCDRYNQTVYGKKCTNKWDSIFIQGGKSCPLREECTDYDSYKKLMAQINRNNGKRK